MSLTHSLIFAGLTLAGATVYADTPPIKDVYDTPDVTVIQAAQTTFVSLVDQDSPPIDQKLCDAVVAADGTRNCTQAVLAALKDPKYKFPSSAATDFLLSPGGPLPSGVPVAANECATFTVTLAVKQVAMTAKTFQGLGFMVQRTGTGLGVQGYKGPDYGKFTPLSSLHLIEGYLKLHDGSSIAPTVKLQDGSLANVYQFVAATECQELGSSLSGLDQYTTYFRPYAQYQDQTTIYHVWDVAPGYTILGSSDAGFQRSDKVLDPTSITPAPPKPVIDLSEECREGEPGIWVTHDNVNGYRLSGPDGPSQSVVTNNSTDPNVLLLSGTESNGAVQTLTLNLTTGVGTYTMTPSTAQAAQGVKPESLEFSGSDCEKIPTQE